MKQDFNNCLKSPVGFKGYGIPEDKHKQTAKFEFEGKEYEIT